MIILPACVVVSAHGSEMDWNFAPASRIVSFRFNQIPGGTRQPVQLPNDDDVADSDLIEHPLKLGTPSGRARHLFTENLLAGRLLQSL